MKKRILVVSHGHPDLSLGGAEIASYNLFKTYLQHEEVEDAWYLARADRGRGITGQIHKRRDKEYLWEQGISDWHLMKAAHQESIVSWFIDLLRAIKPTIVHIHHYAHLGLEFIWAIKQFDQSIKIFMTLHEYMAICKHNGQMVKTGNEFRLCYRESYDECRACFPEHTAEDFWLRKNQFRSAFSLVDGFISPSGFLRQRYIDWGINPKDIWVIENGQPDLPTLPPRELRSGETRNRFAFFGQINPYKGINLLLSALLTMTESERSTLQVEIHGSDFNFQPDGFMQEVATLADPLIKEGCLRWVGSYEPAEQRSRLSEVDWVIIPSTWWENSPLVIQEAFSAGRPLIASNIGGMAEKVTDKVDGLHFNSGNKFSLAATMLKASADNRLWDELSASIKKPVTNEECAEAHLAVFDKKYTNS